MRAAAELEQQAVLADLAVGAQAVGGGGQVDGAVMLVDLDGVATAESDVRTAFAAKMGEVAQAADLAARARGGGGNFGALVLPEVPGEQGCGALLCSRRSDT